MIKTFNQFIIHFHKMLYQISWKMYADKKIDWYKAFSQMTLEDATIRAVVSSKIQ